MINNIIKELNNVLEELKLDEIPVHFLEQRGIGDVIECKICEIFNRFYNNHDTIIVESSSGKKSVEDIQLRYGDSLLKFDIKTHNIDSNFSMPNLISIDRLKNYYTNENNHLLYIFVNYRKNKDVLMVEDINTIPIEDIDWSILEIQNIGTGQLQIKNMKNGITINNTSRHEWLKMLKKKSISFYDKLIEKSIKRKNEWSSID